MFGRKRHEVLETRAPETVDGPGSIGQEVGFIAIEGATDSLFGVADLLSKDLDRYSEGWQEVNTTISAYLDEDGSIDMLERTIKEYDHSHSNLDDMRGNRRYAQKLAQHDLDDFVAGHIMLARLSNYRATRNRLSRNVENMSDVREVTSERRSALGKIYGKWQAVRETTCEHTPTAGQFYDSLEKLGERVSPHFSKAAKAEAKVTQETARYLNERTTNSLELVRSIENLTDSPDPRHVTFLQIMAKNYIEQGDSSLIGVALANTESLAKGGLLVQQFIAEMQDKNNGDNMVAFMKTLFESVGIANGRFVGLVAGNRENWPKELVDGYDTFAKSYVVKLQSEIQKIVQAYVDKQQVEPTYYETEEIFDRLMRRVVGGPKQKAQMNDVDRDRQRRNFKPAKARALPPRHEVQRAEKLKLALLSARGSGTFDYAEDGAINDYMDDISDGRSGDHRYSDDLAKMLDYLSENPFGPGSVPLKDVNQIIVGNKRTQVYRLNPNHTSGLSLGTTAKESRVIYTVVNGSLCVLKIFCNHGDYDKYVRNLRA